MDLKHTARSFIQSLIGFAFFLLAGELLGMNWKFSYPDLLIWVTVWVGTDEFFTRFVYSKPEPEKSPEDKQ